MSILYAYITGIVVALMSSVPVGPINFAIMQAAFSQGRRTALMIGLGGMIADTVICFVALWLCSFFDEGGNQGFFKWINYATIPVVFYLGIKMIRNRNETPKTAQPKKVTNGIMLGAMLGVTNPTLLAYWVWVGTYVISDGWVKPLFSNYFSFSMGVASGITLFFVLFVGLCTLGSRKLSMNFKSRFSTLVGIGFIVFGCFMLIRMITKIV